MKTKIKVVLIFSLLCASAAFAGDDQTPQRNPKKDQTTIDEKGNGGWPVAARAALLQLKYELAKEIRAGTQDLLNQYLGAAPTGNEFITREEVTPIWLADLIEKTHDLLNEELLATQEIGRFFSYHVSVNGLLWLSAEKAFYYSYEAVVLGGIPGNVAYEIKRKLLHEAAHLWGYDETHAENFSKNYLDALSQLHVQTDAEKESEKVARDECLKIKAEVDEKIAVFTEQLKNDPFSGPLYRDAEALAKYNKDWLEKMRVKTLSFIEPEKLIELGKLIKEYHDKFTLIKSRAYWRGQRETDDLLNVITKNFRAQIVSIVDPAFNKAVQNLRRWPLRYGDGPMGHGIALNGTTYWNGETQESVSFENEMRFLNGETDTPFIYTPKGNIIGNFGIRFGFSIENGLVTFERYDDTGMVLNRNQMITIAHLWKNDHLLTWIDTDKATVGWNKRKSQNGDQFVTGLITEKEFHLDLLSGAPVELKSSDNGQPLTVLNLMKSGFSERFNNGTPVDDFLEKVYEEESRITGACKGLIGNLK